MQSGLFRVILSVGLALAFTAEAETVGRANRVQNEVTAEAAGTARPLAAADPLMFGDVLRAHEAARLEATLNDDTQLTLGENATVTIDDFIYAPDKAGNRLALKVLGGAFLFVGGKVEAGEGAQVQISTTFATLGVRGTTVWGGPLDGAYAVLVLDGEVTVTNAGTTVTLVAGSGTTLADEASPPQPPVVWGRAKVDRAIATVSFGN